MAFYLFPGVMYRRLEKYFKKNSKFFYNDQLENNIKDSYYNYNISIKKYLGFGAILQFIPGTDANDYKRALSLNLSTGINIALKKIDYQAYHNGYLYTQ